MSEKFTALPDAEKSRIVCEAFGVEPSVIWHISADGGESFIDPEKASYPSQEAAAFAAANWMDRGLIRKSDAPNGLTMHSFKHFPPLTTDFLLELARKNCEKVELAFERSMYDGWLVRLISKSGNKYEISLASEKSPIDALAIALFKMKGVVV